MMKIPIKRYFGGAVRAFAVLSLAFAWSAQAEDSSVIVHTAQPYDGIVAAIEGMGGTVKFTYENVDGLAADIAADKLADLQGMPGVDLVEPDYIVDLPAPREEQLQATLLDVDASDVLGPADVADLGVDPENYYSYLSNVTGAVDTWADTGFGSDSIVAVIDTGTQASHLCLASRVIEGPDFSTDAGTPLEGSVLASNHFHGTFVGGQVAANCAIFDLFPGGLFTTHLPPEAFFPISGGFAVVPLLGIAPAAEIYAIKVFPSSGAGASSSRINAAIDHAITTKMSGTLDIDVINMSLGGASLNDGRSLQEMLVDAATDAGITTVISAGNEGPAPNTVARPGTAFSAVTVAAATDPVHTRIFWDFFTGGGGTTLYPADELRVSDFSSQGPYADGRQGPDLIATGVFNFGQFTSPSGTALGWASGTSFSAPQVSGAAALLNAWAENNDPSITAQQIGNALIDGAVPMGSEWSVQAQGSGFLNVPNALSILQGGGGNNGARHASAGGKLKPNVLLGRSNSVSQHVTLERGRWVDWVFEIDENTEKIVVEIDTDGLTGPGPSGAFGFFESFELYVKSAKRGGIGPDFVDSANVFNDATVEILAGATVQAGGIAGDLVAASPFRNPPATLEPGLMKVTLQSDWTNNTQFLSADVTITRVQGGKGNNAGGATATLGDGEFGVFFVNVPTGTTTATFDLAWKHDWTKFPTNDLDLILISPSFGLNFAGATLNAPEQAVIANPEAGSWIVIVNGFQVQHGRDPYDLEVTLE